MFRVGGENIWKSSHVWVRMSGFPEWKSARAVIYHVHEKLQVIIIFKYTRKKSSLVGERSGRLALKNLSTNHVCVSRIAMTYFLWRNIHSFPTLCMLYKGHYWQNGVRYARTSRQNFVKYFPGQFPNNIRACNIFRPPPRPSQEVGTSHWRT